MSPAQAVGEGANDEYASLAPLLIELHNTTDGHDRGVLRDKLVAGYLPLAQHIARRFAGRGQPAEDLNQVATIGLINAIDRYQPDRGSDFLSFAVPTIMGEVRRYFRDNSWAVRVPRRLKELHLAISKASGELFQQLGRSPSPSELAAHLHITKDQVFEALEAGNAYHPTSVEAPRTGDGAGRTIAETVGADDPALATVEYQQLLRPLISELPEREQRILALRFFDNRTQSEIAKQVGVSQMHVSRLLSKTLARLRADLS